MASLSELVGPPTAAICPPGQCVFTADWSQATLLERTQLTHDVILVTFGLPDGGKPLGLSTCACILTKFSEEGNPEPIIRPYTPISTNAMTGKFQLVIKVYPEGKFSQYIAKLAIGSAVDFKHIDKNVKVQYPFGRKNITMLTGGTGITPMIQALHAILGTAGDDTKVTLLFGNKTQQDVLCKDVLDQWASAFPDRLKVVHVLSEAMDDETWTGAKGHIGQELISQNCAGPSDDLLVVVCGPPPMYTALCGDRDKPDELTGLLSEMGYKAEQVYKF